jgi:hypothetical protein
MQEEPNVRKKIKMQSETQTVLEMQKEFETEKQVVNFKKFQGLEKASILEFI